MEGKKLVIDENALEKIRDLALGFFREEPKPDHVRVIVRALNAYLHHKGVTPNWEVKL